MELADGGDGLGPALGLSDHSQETRRGEDLAGKLVHARGGGGAVGSGSAACCAGRSSSDPTARIDV